MLSSLFSQLHLDKQYAHFLNGAYSIESQKISNSRTAMPNSTLAGHPLHSMLIVVSAALIPFGFVMDALYRAIGKESHSGAAYLCRA